MSKQFNSYQARSLAIQTISRSLNGEDLQACLNNELNKSNLPERDKNLTTTLSYNYLRLKGRIDYIATAHIHNKPEKLPKKFFLCLGLAIYEMLYLEKIPFYASVNWYVGYIKQKLSNRLAKTANAILRQISNNIEKVQSPDFFIRDNPSDKVFLSRYFSCPQWIIELWINSYGKAACETLLKNSIQSPLIGIRINKTLPEADELWHTLYNIPDLKDNCEYTFAFSKTPNIDLKDLESDGVITRQSPQIEKTLYKLNTDEWEMPIWDCCSGNGNKTTLLLEKGFEPVWASDLFGDKIIHCRGEINRLNLGEIPLFVANAAHNPPLKKQPQTVLLDTPCSGLGVLSRRPDIKWKRNLKDIEKISGLQKEIMNIQVNFLPSKGRIVYFTCTTNPGENEHVVEKIINKHKNSLELEREYKPEFDLENNYCCEHFYAAVIKKK